MALAVEIRDLAKHFGAFHAVDGITFDVDEGEIFAEHPDGRGLVSAVEQFIREILNRRIPMLNRRVLTSVVVALAATITTRDRSMMTSAKRAPTASSSCTSTASSTSCR
jgi:hypothetical protein